MKQYAEQCSNDTGVHNIFPILRIHATSKKRMFRNQTNRLCHSKVFNYERRQNKKCWNNSNLQQNLLKQFIYSDGTSNFVVNSEQNEN